MPAGRIAFFAFILLSVVNLLANVFEGRLAERLTKPLLMPLLFLAYLLAAQTRDPLIAGALCCGFAGDVFLMFPKTGAAGYFAFLAGHLLYAYDFAGAVRLESVPEQVWLLAIPYLVFGAGFLIFAAPRLRWLSAPFFIYMLCVSAMSFASLLRAWELSGTCWMTFAGSLFFIASDSMIALEKCSRRGRKYPFAVMFTYIAAQFLIVAGCVA